MAEIVRRAARLVVMTGRAQEILRAVHAVPPERVLIVPHGIPDTPLHQPDLHKAGLDAVGRTVLLTFGLLSPGKRAGLTASSSGRRNRSPPSPRLAPGRSHCSAQSTTSTSGRRTLRLSPCARSLPSACATTCAAIGARAGLGLRTFSPTTMRGWRRRWWLPGARPAATTGKWTGWRRWSGCAEFQTASAGHFRPIGSDGFWRRGGERALFDQQPLEAGASVAACLEAWRATRSLRWLAKLRRAYRLVHGVE